MDLLFTGKFELKPISKFVEKFRQPGADQNNEKRPTLNSVFHQDRASPHYAFPLRRDAVQEDLRNVITNENYFLF